MAGQTLSQLGYTKAGQQWSPDLYAGPIATAATQYGVPRNILTGVFGQETDLGALLKTSSAGAEGAFQFLPSTAAQYSYPLTNDPTAAQFQQQANAAAHYLSDLYKQTGSWDVALQHYSGGGYGLSQVLKQAGSTTTAEGIQAGGFPSAGAVQATTDVVGGAVSGAESVAQAVSKIADLVSSTSFWLRLGEGIAAVLLIYLGLHALTGQSSSAGQQVKHVTRVMPIPI
jgi:hypothetical protein